MLLCVNDLESYLVTGVVTSHLEYMHMTKFQYFLIFPQKKKFFYINKNI